MMPLLHTLLQSNFIPFEVGKNHGWGYFRIKGELKKLVFRGVNTIQFSERRETLKFSIEMEFCRHLFVTVQSIGKR